MTLSGDYFDAMYEANHDPWGFNSRWYEERKRAITLAVLPERRYANAYEPGARSARSLSVSRSAATCFSQAMFLPSRSARSRHDS